MEMWTKLWIDIFLAIFLEAGSGRIFHVSSILSPVFRFLGFDFFLVLLQSNWFLRTAWNFTRTLLDSWIEPETGARKLGLGIGYHYWYTNELEKGEGV